jgi:hypothetical protein
VAGPQRLLDLWFDQSKGYREGGVYIQFAGFKQDRIRGRAQRRCFPRPVAFVPRANVRKHGIFRDDAAALLEFEPAPVCTYLRARIDEKFGLGTRANDRTDVAAVDHCAIGFAWGIRCEGALVIQKGGAHARKRSDDRRSLCDFVVAQIMTWSVRGIYYARGGRGTGFIGGMMAAA